MRPESDIRQLREDLKTICMLMAESDKYEPLLESTELVRDVLSWVLGNNTLNDKIQQLSSSLLGLKIAVERYPGARQP